MPLGEALKALAKGLGAQAAAISRHASRSAAIPQLVALYPGAASHPLERGFCDDVLGYRFGHARNGTIWYLSDMQDDTAWTPSIALDVLLDAGHCAEIAVIPLSGGPQTVDYIEFHFADPLTRGDRLDLEAIVPTIQRSWAGRKPGLVSGATGDARLFVARRQPEPDRAPTEASILGMSNPANLSRAEFRVCLLLARGLSVKAVTEELQLSENTVRSHLRSIYSKTGASSLPELIYRILSVAPETEQGEYKANRA